MEKEWRVIIHAMSQYKCTYLQILVAQQVLVDKYHGYGDKPETNRKRIATYLTIIISIHFFFKPPTDFVHLTTNFDPSIITEFTNRELLHQLSSAIENSK